MMARHLKFFILWTLSLALFWPVLVEVMRLSLHDRRYAHIILIPVISVCLIYLRRKTLFLGARYCPRVGAPLLLAGVTLYAIVRLGPASATPNESLAAAMFAIVLAWAAAFVFFYGRQSFLAARFPLLFLVLMIPVPPLFVDKAIVVLQNGSAETAYALFRLAGETVYRQEFTFSLPGVDIEIAPQCSGVRTTQALVIAGILAGHVFLLSSWRKVCLTVCTVPIAIFTNAARIVAMSLLAVHGSPRFLYGDLHDYTGRLFSVLSLSLLAAALFALRKSEVHSREHAEPKSNSALPAPPPGGTH